MKRILIVIILLIAEVAFSEESDYTIGLFGSYNWSFHDVNFQQLPGYPNCCSKFENGTGWGYRTGILLEHKLSDLLYINSRMFYQEIESDISTSETTQLIQDNLLIDGEFEHNISTNMTFINMSVGLGIKITNNLSLETGVYFSKNLLAEFNQSENISKPLNSATFVDSNGNDTYRRIRNEFSGNLRNLNNLIYGLTGKISYNLPLSKRGNIRFVPELAYHVVCLGGSSGAGGKLKSIGTIELGDGLWLSPNTGATNETKFKGLPGGSRYWTDDCFFHNLNSNGQFWSFTEWGGGNALGWHLYFDNPVFQGNNHFMGYGFSIRCVRD